MPIRLTRAIDNDRTRKKKKEKRFKPFLIPWRSRWIFLIYDYRDFWTNTILDFSFEWKYYTISQLFFVSIPRTAHVYNVNNKYRTQCIVLVGTPLFTYFLPFSYKRAMMFRFVAFSRILLRQWETRHYGSPRKSPGQHNRTFGTSCIPTVYTNTWIVFILSTVNAE